MWIVDDEFPIASIVISHSAPMKSASDLGSDSHTLGCTLYGLDIDTNAGRFLFNLRCDLNPHQRRCLNF